MLTAMVRWGVFALIGLTLVLSGAKRKRDRTATVIVRSTTTGAQIYIDGDHLGEVPMKLPMALRAGQHTVKVTLMGYADYLDTFTIKPGRDTVLEVDLLPVAGVLRVDGDPRGAWLIVDGRAVGQLPYEGELEPGPRVIEVRADGYAGQKRRLAVEAGQTYPLDVALTPLPPPEAAAPTPWYGHWWVWAGAAVVVAGGLTAILLIDGDDPPAAPDFALSIEPTR